VNRDVIVALESSEEMNRDLLAEGSRIAQLLGGSLSALLAEPSTCNSAAWVRSAKAHLEKQPFRVLLFAHTDKGRERSPLMAQTLGAAAVTDCFDIRFRNGALCYARYVYGGQFEQEVTFAHPPEIVSLKVESLEAQAGLIDAPVPFKSISMQVPENDDVQKTIAIIPPDSGTVDIRYAKRILDIGAGCDRPELLMWAQELAGLLNASVGTTRLVVDNGRIPKTRMIGQTGKTASPELCLALGVSGSPHHVAGIRKAVKIFAVNSAERAPIFSVSDAGFVTDLNSLLPELITRIKRYRDGDIT
jgi:electron transfer flavoprotein alpha subunit